MNFSQEQKLLTDKEAPDVVGVKRKTLQEWRRLGKGPPFIRVSNRCYYVYRDLLTFLETCPRTVARRSRNQEGK
jgi:predicted site-specific integrase-resolvase